MQRHEFERGPRVGETVHYVSYGTPGGEYTKECRAAIVTEVTEFPDADGTAGLCVLNPTGLFLNQRVPHAEDKRLAAIRDKTESDCPQSWSHGNPMRYCACGWTEPEHPGGTWHWPETRNEEVHA
jgi:hypothetical protein